MGFFSWNTMDTDKSIANEHSNRKTFRVQMMDNKGNVWTEDNYDGYGRFGGKDYYELLAEMNGFTSDKTGDEYTDEARGFGINIAFKDNGSGIATAGVLYPNLVEKANGWNYEMAGPDNCEYQGYFYDEEDLDGEDDYES
jgi:hypothetical protein